MGFSKSWPLVVAASLFLAACGGGGGGGDGSPSSASVSGGVVKGPTSGATVCAFAIRNGSRGAQLSLTSSGGSISNGCFVTAADGTYNITLPAGTGGDVLLESTGGRFCSDESQVSGGACPAGTSLVDLGASAMTAVTTASAGNAAVVYVTPLTTAAVNNAGANLSASSFNAQFSALASQVLGSATRVTPATPPDGSKQPYLTQVSTYLAGGGTLTAAIDALEAGRVPRLDVRNGSYAAYVGDARKYTLALNFDAASYSVTNGTTTVGGSFTASGNGFEFARLPGSTAAVNNAKFSIANETIIGGVDLGGGVLPFVASRSFATTLADAVGIYDFLSVTLDGNAPNTSIQAGEITSGGQVRFCNDLTIYRIDLCPAGSVSSGTVTLAGDEFTSTTPEGAFTFRVIRIGSDRIFVRASPSTAGSRRLLIGTQLAAYAPGSFTAVDSLGSRGTVTVSPPTAFSQTLVTAAGATDTLAGTSMDMAGGPNSPPGIVGNNTAATGFYFSIRSPNIHVLVASRSSTVRPLYLQIGRPQQ